VLPLPIPNGDRTPKDNWIGIRLGEAKKQDVLKDQAMLKCLNDIASFPQEDKQHILYTLDALIKTLNLNKCKSRKPTPATSITCNYLNAVLLCVA